MARELWRTNKVVLERGGPWEINPADNAFWREQARAYLAGDEDPEAKARVKRVWVEGRGYEPAWLGSSGKIPDEIRPKQASPRETEEVTPFG